MKKTTLIILFTLIAGFLFSQSQIDYMQPEFKGDVSVSDTLFINNKLVKLDGSTWREVPYIGTYNKVIAMTSGDATPDVSNGTLLDYSNGTAAVTVTNLDNSVVGAIYTIVGGNYPITIANGGNFAIGNNIMLFDGDVLGLYCRANENDGSPNVFVRMFYNLNMTYDYYVSTTGNDTYPGTSIDSAWLTMSKAETTVTDGNAVMVLPGTYEMGALTFDQNVTWYGYGATLSMNAATATFLTMSGNDVKTFYGFTFERNKTGTYTIGLGTAQNNLFYDCNLTESSTTAGYAIASAGASGGNTVFNGCLIRSGSGGLSQSYPDLTFSNCTLDSLKGFGIDKVSTYRNTLTIDGCTLNVLSGTGILLRGGGGFADIKNSIFNTIGNITTLISVSTVTQTHKVNIENCTFNINNTASVEGYINLTGSNQNAADTLNVEGCTFNLYASANVGAFAAYIIDTISFVDNTVNNLSLANKPDVKIWKVGSTDGKFYVAGNVIYAKHPENMNLQIGPDDPTAFDYHISGVVEKNAIYSVDYYANAYTAVQKTVHCLFVGYATSAVIRYNYVNGAGYGIVGEDNLNGSYVAYNIIDNCLYGGIFGGLIGDNNDFYGNTFIGNNDDFVRHIYITYGADTTTIKNNIFYKTTGITGEDIWAHDTITGIVVDYNISYGISDNPFYTIATNDYDGWAAIQGAGYEANGVNADPNFSASGYYVKTGSPAIAAGVDLGATYETGLSKTTIWPSSVVTGTQPATWTIGAYVDYE